MQDDGVFDKMIDTVYKETSQHLLHVLHVNYKFMDHLKVNTPHPTECYIIWRCPGKWPLNECHISYWVLGT